MDRIQGKFYPLKTSEVVGLRKLTKSQILVLQYIKTADPYGNGARIKASKIAEELEITKRAVNSAIAVLAEKGFIDIEEADYIVKVVPTPYIEDSNSTVTEPRKEFPAGKKISHSGTKFPTEDENFPPENKNSHLAPETPATKEVREPKINKTYTDFKDSLSVEERESFLKFGLKMAADLPKPPQLPKKWIAKNWEEVRDKWLQASNKPSTNQTNKWENHPSRVEWLNEINQLGAVSFMCDDEGNVDPERKEFFEWAEKANLIE